MRRTGGAQESRSDGGHAKQIQEIEELERRIKQWSFEVNDGVGSIPEVHQIEGDIREILDEEYASVVLAEAEKLQPIMESKHGDMARKQKLLENDIQLLENEIKNKIIHKMDTEDIKYSIYRLLLTKEKTEIYTEAADTYKSIVDSLNGLRDLKQPASSKHEYLSVKKVIHSEFYAAKVRAKICYENCYQKLLLLNREAGRIDLEQRIINEYLRFKSLCSNKLL